MEDIVKKILLVSHPLLASFLVSFLGNSNYSREWYSKLIKSPLTPPGPVFPVVWTVLYILLGLNIYYIYNKIVRLNRHSFFNYEFTERYLIPFEIQLVLNLSWSIFFFRFKKPIVSLAIVILMIGFTIYLLYRSWYIDKTAFYLIIPYLLWISFAAYLNFYIVVKN